MANQDFLITFSVDGTQALLMMDQIGHKATALEARLNALGRGTGGTAAGGVLKQMGVTPAAVNQSAAAIAGLEAKLKSLRASYAQMRDARVATGGTAKGFAFSEVGTAFRAEIKATKEALAALQTPTSTGAGNVLNKMGLAPGQVAQSTAAVSGLAAQVGKIPVAANQGAQAMGGLSAQVARLQAGISARQALGLPVSASQFATAAVATQRLAQNMGLATVAGGQFARQAANLAAQSKVAAQQLDQTSQAFGRHTQRIFEAIIVYEAFGRAVQAVQAGVDLIIDIDRESRRLEAVLDIDAAQSAQFVQGLGEIASQTVTPVRDLVSEADRASAAFLDIEDPAERAAAALELMNDAGKFTTVTQRDMGVEVTNLIAIMKQLNIPIGELDNTLGKIVTAGGNSSTVIAGLADALQISSRAASQAGVDLDILLGIESEFLIQTGRTGSEVGNLFKLLFQRLSDPDVAQNVSDITGGLLKMRDAAGNIRDPIQIMLELNALFETGAITATQFRDVIETFAPPLNPAAKADFILINELLGEIGPKVAEIGRADVSALDDLVTKINDALGPQFKKLVIDAQLAFVNLFQDDVIEGGFTFIEVIRGIGSALAELPPGVLESIVKLGVFLGTLKAISFIGGRLAGLLGVAGIAGTFRTIGANVVTATAGMSGMAGAMTGLRVAVVGLASAMWPLLAAIAAFMAIDFIGKINEMQDALRGQIGGNLAGQDTAGLLAERQRLIDQLSDQGRAQLERGPQTEGLRFTFLEGVSLEQFTTDPALLEGIAEIDRLLKEIGADGTVALDDLSEGFSHVAESSNDAAQEAQFLSNLAGAGSLSEADRAAQAYAQSLQGMTQAEREAAIASDVLKTLADEQADALLDLNERLKEGAISQAQWNAGQNEVAQAAQLSANLVATFGDQLRTLVPELGNAAAGNDALAAALFNMFIHSTNALPALQRLAAAAIADAQATQIVGVQAQITAVKFDQLALSAFRGAAGIDAMNRAAVRSIALHPHLISVGGVATNGTTSASTSTAAIFEQMRRLFATTGSTTFGTGLPSFSIPKTPATPAQAGILDIGDLSAAQVSQLIAIATTLRNAIPGETAASKDDLVAIIKDAQLLTNVKGIDERLLKIALDELTEAMDEANRLERERIQKEAILSNLVVSAGPLSGLVSQPTLFGVGGSLASGTGLNFDPTQGNFTINVPIELQGLEPARLQELIYNIIAQAIRDSLRL